ncbi:Tim44/TimA family putative adaptor protein [Dongia sp.]|uniref:Tim44/TimA family putative adaptor protein n=1 Tax=Dongia sp. TaxID=1977262 RepID=UPI0035AE6ECF
MQHLDIVFFAIVAVVLGWKLYSVLGRRTGNERRVDPFARPDPKDLGTPKDLGRNRETGEAPTPIRRPTLVRSDREPAVEPQAEPASRSGMSPRDRRQIEADIARASDSVRDGLAAIAKADPTFNPVDFIGGAKIAFDMIVEGFAAGETKMLQSLLARDLYESFASVIADRQAKGLKQKTEVIGITQAQIVGAELSGRIARVTVKFVSEQTSVTEDAQGNVVEGDATHVDSIIDIWTFARDTGSRDPNWQLVMTEQPN